jgi:hypothetical protein
MMLCGLSDEIRDMRYGIWDLRYGIGDERFEMEPRGRSLYAARFGIYELVTGELKTDELIKASA